MRAVRKVTSFSVTMNAEKTEKHIVAEGIQHFCPDFQYDTMLSNSDAVTNFYQSGQIAEE